MFGKPIIEGMSWWQYERQSRDWNSNIRNANIHLQNMINKWNSKKRELAAFIRKIQKLHDDYRKDIDTRLAPELVRLNNEIKIKEREIAELESEIDELESEITKYTNKLRNLDEKFPGLKEKIDKERKQILPLKKKEFSSANQYYKMLTYQNDEISNQIISQRNDLTAADRKYITTDSTIPFYSDINIVLLLTYITIAGYVSYLIAYGMVTNNRYGKIILILLIILYPIYMFAIEKQIYDKFNMFNSMVRAVPYRPVE